MDFGCSNPEYVIKDASISAHKVMTIAEHHDEDNDVVLVSFMIFYVIQTDLLIEFICSLNSPNCCFLYESTYYIIHCRKWRNLKRSM